MSKKVIITGASGQDGSLMVEYLLKNTDFKIIGAVRRTSQPILSNLTFCIDNNRFSLHPMDLTDSSSIKSLIHKELPDYFINFGAQTFVADSWTTPSLHMETNAMSLIHILESVKEYCPNCRVYSSGTSEQFGNVKYTPQDENHPMSPRSIYGVSKCAASHICKVYRESYGLYIVHGILFNHESERRQEYFVTRKISKGVAKIFDSIVNKKPVIPIQLGNLSAERDWSYAEDVVDAVWRMLNQEEYNCSLNTQCGQMGIGFLNKNYVGIDDLQKEKYLSKFIKDYVVSSDEKHSIREFVEEAFKICSIKGSWMEKNTANEYFWYSSGPNPLPSNECKLVVVNPKFYRPAEVELLRGDSSKIRTELGWSPKTSFQGLVEKMVENDLKLLT